ncbi:PD-(D/E)XK nuclease family protein [Robiginitalea sp.]|mgnify:CR=1 FL=1|nr:PD-(D/E)XK nuclease family protein [Robiginitalea sp.]
MAKKVPSIVKEIRNNPPSPINFAFQKNISYSQMSIFRGCPHRWKLQYKDKIKRFTSSIHTVFGTAIHEVMQHYLDTAYEKSFAAADREIDIEEYFKETFVNEYQSQYKKNNNEHFSDASEMREFFEDGLGILNWFKKKRSGYFSKKNTWLVGCEVPVILAPNKMYNNIMYMGYLDVVTYNEVTDTFKIIDIKTSTKGWNDYSKKDENKQFQLLLYKQFFSEQYNIPLDKIEIEFFIVKRKVLDWDDENLMSPYQAHRVQTFTPPSGKIKLNRAKTAMGSFINECFNSNGEIKETIFPKTPSKWTCTFCPFKEDKELCGAGLDFM